MYSRTVAFAEQTVVYNDCRFNPAMQQVSVQYRTGDTTSNIQYKGNLKQSKTMGMTHLEMSNADLGMLMLCLWTRLQYVG